MTRHYLAIPVGSFLVFSTLFPACAQTNPDNPQGQTEAAVVAVLYSAFVGLVAEEVGVEELEAAGEP